MLKIILKIICGIATGLLFYLFIYRRALFSAANTFPLETALTAVFMISLVALIFMVSAVLLIYKLFDG